MFRIVLAVIVAFAFASLDTADAASKRKRQKVRSGPVVTMPAKPALARKPGPAWAGPNDCYTDEGYGRYLQCGAGMDM